MKRDKPTMTSDELNESFRYWLMSAGTPRA